MNNTLYLHRDVYSPKNICLAIQEFGKIADIQINDKGTYWICIFDNCLHEVQKTICEFENYLIAITNQGVMEDDCM